MQHLTGSHRRVALFGGTYNNWAATRAVLDDARRRDCDGIYFLGDVGGFGPHPDRSVEVLREADIGTIQGNYDDSVGNAADDCACGYTDPRDNHYAQLSYDYTLANTSEESRSWLREMPTSAKILVGGRVVYLCHGSPRRVNEFLWESTTPAGFIDHLLQTVQADLIACTHTGLHWGRRLPDGRGVVNVGAVGRPANDGRRNVWYCILEVIEDRLVTTFAPIAYDWERVIGEMRDEGLPDVFVETLATGWWTTCLEVLPGRERIRGRF